ncbi:hypothetical protein CHS0354_030481 [Potamilus streckersoni]|uniref:Uncharacterized protein n=1 Tax=Potamilus streckersoni TaxID=2493646 RepID=A0AAE0RQ04_9BIVA|nr:hypothetical protein CHS0354_030481 [Potamilus streckersoni]
MGYWDQLVGVPAGPLFEWGGLLGSDQEMGAPSDPLFEMEDLPPQRRWRCPKCLFRLFGSGGGVSIRSLIGKWLGFL